MHVEPQFLVDFHAVVTERISRTLGRNGAKKVAKRSMRDNKGLKRAIRGVNRIHGNKNMNVLAAYISFVPVIVTQLVLCTNVFFALNTCMA